ncbi:Cap15 family cyclic dinucleotide receptor domain-containing protein [Clostridium guangxiense]|uniref:Cap15 family cyclic dinucleotide receptor domain-containing protein n=1 Tax=Clostridium guangxiense TaxID=1662055 RepID=UPI001E5730BA|nr:hypothetical protein [Clostridium guangxiense]MCD2348879.1 hypothetical protein [Clostridium guangxiense]
MHSYSIDTKERIYVIFYLALISVLGVVLLKDLLKLITFIPLSISISSASLSAFLVLYKLFDKYFWKWKLIRFIFKIKTPILSGDWEGEYESSYKKDGERVNGTVKINISQTWSKISIRCLNSGSSKSYSQIAGIFIKHSKGIVLKYEYENEPEDSFVDSMGKHSGFECLVFDEKDNTMSGTYYTDKYRRTFGTKHYKKIP